MAVCVQSSGVFIKELLVVLETLEVVLTKNASY